MKSVTRAATCAAEPLEGRILFAITMQPVETATHSDFAALTQPTGVTNELKTNNIDIISGDPSSTQVLTRYKPDGTKIDSNNVADSGYGHVIPTDLSTLPNTQDGDALVLTNAGILERVRPGSAPVTLANFATLTTDQSKTVDVNNVGGTFTTGPIAGVDPAHATWGDVDWGTDGTTTTVYATATSNGVQFLDAVTFAADGTPSASILLGSSAKSTDTTPRGFATNSIYAMTTMPVDQADGTVADFPVAFSFDGSVPPYFPFDNTVKWDSHGIGLDQYGNFLVAATPAGTNVTGAGSASYLILGAIPFYGLPVSVDSATVSINDIVGDQSGNVYLTLGAATGASPSNVVWKSPLPTDIPGLMAGVVWQDDNANQKFDPNEKAILARPIYVDLNNNGKPDSNEPIITTDVNGIYEFGDVPAGTYNIRQVLPTGWEQTYPANNAPETVTLGNGEENLGLDFGSRPTQSGNDTAPTVNPISDITTAKVGTPVTQHGTFTDPDAGDSWTATVDYGDGKGAQPLTLNSDMSFDLNHTYTSGGNYTVTVVVTDAANQSGSTSFHVNVSGAAINLVALTPIAAGSTMTANGTITDTGATALTATVDYGDGAGAVPLTLNPDGSFSLSHPYASPGTYNVVVTANDSGAAVGSRTLPLTVNDPDGITRSNGGTYSIVPDATVSGEMDMTVTACTVSFAADLSTDFPKVSLSATGTSSLVFDASQTLAGLSLASGTSATVDSVTGSRSATNHRVLVVSSLSIDPASKLDLNDNDLVFKNGGDAGLSMLVPLLLAGRNVAPGGIANGTWNGSHGIVSSAAHTQDAADGQETVGLGIGLYGDMPFAPATFDGSKPGPNDVLIKYTYTGDVNLDGQINNQDVATIAGDYDNGLTTTNVFYLGDLNGDGKIDNKDVTILAGFYGNGTAASGLPLL